MRIHQPPRRTIPQSASLTAPFTQGSLFMFIYNSSIFLTSTAFVDTNAKYGIPLSRYTVFLQNCPLERSPIRSVFFYYEILVASSFSEASRLIFILPSSLQRAQSFLAISSRETSSAKSSEILKGLSTT